ncbi:alpha-latrocrustotoxin-Lt1a-like [Haliotis rufescens]|uniref:alpha-latrocrustotoxin-Lt1a-like n=1 Tax=Haliotis rufescens TaxID=6454 RepID=UPI00201F1762|nr:alpha-latrocrustotoxin-Lt1a-like [Haliotis rufescens]
MKDFDKITSLICDEDAIFDMVVSYVETRKVSHERYMDKDIYDLRYCVYPVISVAEKGHVTILDFLINSGFDPNYRRNEKFFKRMPIHCACRNGHLDVVKSLVDNHGVDVDSKDAESETPLSMAIYNGSLDIVRFLVESRANISGAMHFERTSPLHVAAKENQPEIVKYLISKGAMVNEVNSYGCPPLHHATLHGDICVVRILLEAGAKTEYLGGNTAFSTATKRENLDMMKLLSSFGADPEEEDCNGYTPLELAIIYERSDIIRYLVVDLNVRTHRRRCGYSPLHIAVEVGNDSAAKLLLKSGCPAKLDYSGFNEGLPVIKQIVSHVRRVARIPNSLKRLSCWKIRDQLGRRLSEVDCLPLPRLLINYVKLSDIP